MPTFTLISADDPFEAVVAQAEAAVRAQFIEDYLAADRAGDLIARAWIAYEIEQYDAASGDEAPLMDEIRGLHLQAAA
jgi:hypothetical protein